HERRVQMRQYRQMIITRKRQTVEAHVVLHESVMHRTIGERKTMSAQLKRLADLSTRPNVSIRILTNDVGVPGGRAPASVLTPRGFSPAPARGGGGPSSSGHVC
ncbi:Scr1 family TA system antitoxin-like transcriptional regulator, partial [Nocardia cyriacigeorgica]|uniref:Scr1 family TA system antitoxin-like transcriptional regulator n=1 Tax=Nocardia cyriacigeorgica TaxID=135487 RepID=UPI002458D046